MIRTVAGKITEKGSGAAIIEVGGIGLRVAMTGKTLEAIGPRGGEARLFTYLNVKEDALDLYGFRTKEELAFFELLISVSGVGPRSALAVLEVAALSDLAAAIVENRPDLLTQAAGIGRKTAERIIVELKTRVPSVGSEKLVATMDSDADILEALVGLGYRRDAAKAALAKIERSIAGVEARLKAALALLANK